MNLSCISEETMYYIPCKINEIINDTFDALSDFAAGFHNDTVCAKKQQQTSTSAVGCATTSTKTTQNLLSNSCVRMDNEKVNTGKHEKLDAFFYIHNKDTHSAFKRQTVHNTDVL